MLNQKDPKLPPTPKEVEKMVFTLYYCVQHSVQLGVLSWVFFQQEWFLTPKLEIYYSDWPRALPEDIRFVYLFQISIYLYGVVILLIQPKQKDMWAMVSHHFVTIFLETFSYAGGYFRTGITVMFMTDVSDPFLHFGKILLYTGYGWYSDQIFVLFAVLFIIPRVILYPYYGIYGAWAYGHGSDGIDIPYLDYMVGSLSFLYILFIYWTYLIVSIALKNGRKGDTRDDDDHDD